MDIDGWGSTTLVPYVGDAPKAGDVAVLMRSANRLWMIGTYGTSTVVAPPTPEPEDPDKPPTQPTTTKVTLKPKATGTARGGSVRGDTSQLYQGDWTGRGVNSGMAVYRAKQLSGTVTKATLRIKRLDAGSYSAQSPTLRLMNQNSLVGNPTWQASQTGPVDEGGRGPHGHPAERRGARSSSTEARAASASTSPAPTPTSGWLARPKASCPSPSRSRSRTMAETPLGLVYPESGDHTRLWEHFQALADSVDGLITARFQVVEATATWASAGEVSTSPFAVDWPIPFVTLLGTWTSTTDSRVVAGAGVSTVTEAKGYARWFSSSNGGQASAGFSVPVTILGIGTVA